MKLKYIGISLITFLCMSSVVNAASCGYEEKAKLNSEAGNVKANSEIKERVLDPSEYNIPDVLIGTPEAEDYVATADYMQVNILNLTENTYIEVSNNVDNEVKTYHYSDTNNGNVSFNWENIDTLITYTIKVYSSSSTSCEGTLLKTLYVALPRYNPYSQYAICNEIPEHYACQKYVTFENLTFNDFINEAFEKTGQEEPKGDNEKEKENNKWYQEIGDFIKENKVAFIIGGLIVVGAGCGITFVVIRKRRRDNI